MKIARFDGGKTGLVVEAGGLMVLDVLGQLPAFAAIDRASASAVGGVLSPDDGQSWARMIDRWDEVRSAFRVLEAHARTLSLLPIGAVALDAPLASPLVHIFGAGSNTVVHVQRAFKTMKNLDMTVEEVMQPRANGVPPTGFTIWPDSVVGPGATITPPPGFTKIDYEAECAVYVKRGGLGIKSVELWGYTAWNDLGVRDPHLGLAPEANWIPFSFNLPKNFDSGNSCGPWAVVDEGDIGALTCKLFVNGEQRQDWPLSDMIYTFEEMLIFIGGYQRLRPGDMLTSGTGAGVAIETGVDGPHWLKPGDVIDIRIEGAGTLTNTMGDW